LKVEYLARRLAVEQPALELSGRFRPLVPSKLEDAPTLHLDDLSTIPLLGRYYDVSCIEDRARLRAGHGDFVASCAPLVPEFEPYCRDQLGLGSVTWLHPRARGRSLRVAQACWTDARVRRRLVHAVRSDRLAYVHPHIGSFLVWAVAHLLGEAGGKPVKVIAPPPALTTAVNHKLWFADVVRRLFGNSALPRTERASDFATLAIAARRLAQDSARIVVKVPDSAGGSGNLVLAAEEIRDLEPGQVRRRLKRLMGEMGWWGGDSVLVSAWAKDVLSSPSTQLWIPPPAEGEPIVEGLYEQMLEGREGKFVGSRPARLPPDLAQEITDRSWLLGRLFQRLGYIGRCSFDMVLIGPSVDRSRIAFIECNGRWGGTSTPMTLINRLFDRWSSRPYASRVSFVPGLTQFVFPDLLEHFADELYDVRTNRGRLILYNPSGLQTPHGIDMIALGNDWDQASDLVEGELNARLEDLVGSSGEAQAPPPPDRPRRGRAMATSDSV
jgi:hypothetical protein